MTYIHSGGSRKPGKPVPVERLGLEKSMAFHNSKRFETRLFCFFGRLLGGEEAWCGVVVLVIFFLGLTHN